MNGMWFAPSGAEVAQQLAAVDMVDLVERFGSPLLLLDVDRFRRQYRVLRELMPTVRPHYAVKALAHPAVLAALRDDGGFFDVASRQEVLLLKSLGVRPQACIHTNPIKKRSDIVAAVEFGVRRFVFDNVAELEKFAGLEGDVELMLRLSFRNADALIDLSFKFGAEPDDALSLLDCARRRGLKVVGVSFHPGSQLGGVDALVRDIRRSVDVMQSAGAAGFELTVLDIGGGYPVPYRGPVPSIATFAQVINTEISVLDGQGVQVLSEPGRIVAGPAMTSVSTVVGVNRRRDSTWYYLDDGVYGSYSNVIFDHVQPTVHAHKALLAPKAYPEGIAVLAGPTCDSSDVIATGVAMPDLAVGDLVVAPLMGAYTSVTASDFNGLAKAVIVPLSDTAGIGVDPESPLISVARDELREVAAAVAASSRSAVLLL